MHERINKALEAMYQLVDQLDELCQALRDDSEYDSFHGAYVRAVKSEAALDDAVARWCDNRGYTLAPHGDGGRMRIEGGQDVER